MDRTHKGGITRSQVRIFLQLTGSASPPGLHMLSSAKDMSYWKIHHIQEYTIMPSSKVCWSQQPRCGVLCACRLDSSALWESRCTKHLLLHLEMHAHCWMVSWVTTNAGKLLQPVARTHLYKKQVYSTEHCLRSTSISVYSCCICELTIGRSSWLSVLGPPPIIHSSLIVLVLEG